MNDGKRSDTRATSTHTAMKEVVSADIAYQHEGKAANARAVDAMRLVIM